MTLRLLVMPASARCARTDPPELLDGFSGLKQRSGEALPNRDDRSLFDAVFLPHLPESYRLARWLTGNGADAEDVVQESSLRAFRAIQTFDGANARAWSLSVVRNTAYSWLLKNRPRTVVLADDLGDADRRQMEQGDAHRSGVQTPEQALLLKLDIESVRDALKRLPAPLREIIVLREMHQLSYREISEIAGIPIGTVMSRLARSRDVLAHMLGEQDR
ncbi:Sigma-24 [Afipia felis]|uniref:Sigma-24 n=2 Tax=Afipia felis TaxID=1035 RepID=A0A380W8Y0_AFIFE|nr:sigma-70 family RNA polymerase sigma factor [Afipia felis]EKS28087.1 sigma-70 family RNA polymerase sigma factor [Afipia felis ATCC 53690]SUU76797.1 Sigma-24 [Afipia felis]SUU84863.1 Sigma-24 [Afipia felis]